MKPQDVQLAFALVMVRRGAIAVALSVTVAGGCTMGMEQSFELQPGPLVSAATGDVLFELTNRGGNTSEPIDVFRIELDEDRLGGGLFSRSSRGDGRIELVQDGGEQGLVEPGDVIRIYEFADGKNLAPADNGRMLVINVMVLDPDQRSSSAKTRSWETVWSSPWRVGG
jgi:hypothetical protein